MKTRYRSSKKCDHREAVVTVTAGIQRTVCIACGAVSIRYDHSVCTEWPESVLRRAETEEPWLVGVVTR